MTQYLKEWTTRVLKKIYCLYKSLILQADPPNSSCSQKLQYPERTAILRKWLFRKSPLQVEIYAFVLLKNLLYLINNCNCCYEIVKLKWNGCKCFCTFNTVLFKQKLLQLALCNKQLPLKGQIYNGFPQISTPFEFSPINRRRIVLMDDWKKCCEINTVYLTCRSLQELLWINDITIEKKGQLQLISPNNRLL